MFGVYRALLATVLAFLALRSDAATVLKDAAMIANGWYSERHAAEFPISNINWDYTQMTYIWA